MAQVNVDIKVDDKSVEKSVEKVKSLRQQIREYQQDISTKKVGSKDFEILSEKLKDARDQMELVNARSGDLFDSFNRLPGPIGMIGSTVQGTLDDLKILSSFSLKDLGKQFGAIIDDVLLIGKNIANTTGITTLFNFATTGLAKGLNAVGISANASSKGLRIFTAALAATGIGLLIPLISSLITNFDKVRDTVYKLIPGLKSVGDFIGGLVTKFTDLVGITNEAERAEKKRQDTYEKSKKATDSINAAIQREIDLLKARGASQDEIDKKRKQIITNEMNDLKKLVDEKGLLYGEDAKKYKDLQNQLKVIDAETAQRRNEERKKNNDIKKAEDEKAAQEEKQFLQAQADAIIQLEKNKEDTNAKTLEDALKKQYELRNEGKKLSVEQQQLQAQEINQIIKDELDKDKETRQKNSDEKLNSLKENNKLIIDELNSNAESQRIIYGETSKEAQKAQDDIFAAQKKALDDERMFLEAKKELTNEEILRLKEIVIEEQNLTNQKEIEGKKRTANALEEFLKSEEQAKNNNISRIEREMEESEYDTERMQELLDNKIRIEEEYYAKLLANKNLTAEQIKKIEEEQTATIKANAETQMSIEQQKFDNQQKLLLATSAVIAATADIVGKNTVAGKALAVASSLINTYAAIAAQLEAAAASPGAGIPGYAIAQAIATGLVGFKAVRDIIATPVPSGGGGGTTPQPRRLASGGIVRGAGGGKSDLIPAMLSNGESVINAESTSLFRPLLSSINQIGGGKKFAEGGLAVSSFSQEQSLSRLAQQLTPSTQPIKTYVVSRDMTNQQMFDRISKNRSTL